ncbi:FadR/GntR family transcriptional regulator [Paracoccus sp. p4-l81]|uniref:FadR/GntR family transcriptional regulator n=1 Tax=unclassified Paracoccus (in: a-proteobacteria) TaxID=2688777 RepID=UPI0035B88BF9
MGQFTQNMVTDGGEGASDAPQNSAEVLARIRAMLAARPAGRLPTERDLAEQLGAGRRAIRRALEVLEDEGLVWRKHGSGTYAGPPPVTRTIAHPPAASPTALIQMIEARLVLEPDIARLAAQRIAPEALRRMRQCAARIETAEDVDSADLWDSALHREIAVAAGNPILLALFDHLNLWRHDAGMRRIRLRARRHAGSVRPVLDEHRLLLDAIAAGDEAGAARAMRDHLHSLRRVFLTFTSEETTPDDG